MEDKPGQHRLHLIGWDDILKPKNCGGLGIKKLSLMNDAFLAKLASKYLNSLLPCVVVQQIQSFLPPHPQDGRDSKRRYFQGAQRITIRVLYAHLRYADSFIAQPVVIDWLKLWKWQGHQRIKLFMWKLWQWRNALEHGQQSNNDFFKGSFVRRMAIHVIEAYRQNKLKTHIGGSSQYFVSWTLPEVDWIKINSDEASIGNLGMAVCGGIFRDSAGSWLGGFTYNIGYCSALVAEYWGILKGLETAWTRG
ncbi:uncharacterized protein LOC133296366 [Gastrolobium bilobum]|uniref:uncharacterized protein LOC133296366 n=1 Tax=Gastrolobium bilobum TaxID=150636 RepID=UPI002AB1D44D|nr:uncharacterized protein LOC133296366 [Gastrolobium bilobum]